MSSLCNYTWMMLNKSLGTAMTACSISAWHIGDRFYFMLVEIQVTYLIIS